MFDEEVLNKFKADCFKNIRGDREHTIAEYVKSYYALVKKEYQSEYTGADPSLNESIFSDPGVPKVLWGGCLDFLKRMDNESVQLMVTSPPYYNAREYSHGKLLTTIWKKCLILSRNVIGFWIITVPSFLMSAIYLITTTYTLNRYGKTQNTFGGIFHTDI